VAHFDFVQLEHIGLIRHARALQHRPTPHNTQSQQCIQLSASRLLQEVMLLELPIADYLQAKAMLGVLASHKQWPATSTLTATDIATQTAIHGAAARQSLLAIQAAEIVDAADK